MPLSPARSATPFPAVSRRRLLCSKFAKDPTHPLLIALRTYILSSFLSVVPSLLPLILSFASPGGRRTFLPENIKAALRRDLGLNGISFAMTAAVAGGAALQRVWGIAERSDDWSADFAPITACRDAFLSLIPEHLRHRVRRLIPKSSLSEWHKTFMSNLLTSIVAIHLLHRGRKIKSPTKSISASGDTPIPFTVLIPSTKILSPTLDLTLLLLVRALDSLVQSEIRGAADKAKPVERVESHNVSKNSSAPEGDQRCLAVELHQKLRSRIDASIFWACSARIMWCFFYKPDRLPKSYLKWIAALANIDPRLPEAARAIRNQKWSYIKGSPTESHILQSLAHDLGRPSSWGDPSIVPAYGGSPASDVWTELGVNGRAGIGGVPCKLLHGHAPGNFGLGDGCVRNASARTIQAFLKAIVIYIPAHFLPIAVVRPRALLSPTQIANTILSTLRSSVFLATFVGSYWYTVCWTRTQVLARFLPQISHDFWDGPYGCILLGSLVCGSSIWIEIGRRRGEMALYVGPKALRTCLPEKWLRSQGLVAWTTERLAFVVSLAWLLTAAVHRPESLRGLSHWTLAFIMRGSRAGFIQVKEAPDSGSYSPPKCLEPERQRL